jgi:muramoyltetrapeptide carboxypeptidase
MARPPYLKQRDKVAVVATAKCLPEGEIDGALQLIESWGLQVQKGQYLHAQDHLFAGSDAQRAADLQWALDDPEVKAVIFARGGYGTARIIDRIDWTSFINQPKWLCGFSDLTVLHAHAHKHWNIETLHSSMPIFFKDGNPHVGANSLQKALFGDSNGLSWDGHAMNRAGEATGRLIGGNASVLYSIASTPSAADWSGTILFLEDLTEYLYHLDRIMMQFKRAGQLERLAGLVVGQFTDMEDGNPSFGKTAQEIIWDAVKEYGYPVAFDAPIGHVEQNFAVFHGRESKLNVADDTKIRF